MTDVAIVGMGAVFPGAGDAPAFWRNIRVGTDAITEVPPDRWDPAVYASPEAGPDRFYTSRGGFLGELAEFDPAPFGIMPASVDGTEPDQLLMLRAAAEALDDGGSLPGDRERVGVIIGRGGYLTAAFSRLDTRVRTVHQLTAVLSDLVPGLGAERLAAIREAFTRRLESGSGSSSSGSSSSGSSGGGSSGGGDASIGLVPNFAASRLANRFDLRGPAYTVDAACASSLVAVDHAVRELATGRCDAVLAGGVHTCHHPTLWSVFTRLRAISPGGVIRPLSAAADGTLLSEGTGAVLLKRLADARAAGDRIYAVIRGVGISSDGRATSMMNPLAEGQELAIRRAWAAAGLDPLAPDALGLLEAHGTATPVGDKAELTALARVFGPAADSGSDLGSASAVGSGLGLGSGPAAGPGPDWGSDSGSRSRAGSAGDRIPIGTVKSMIGHAMPAAGIAGLIKTAFAVHEGVLPPTLHVGEPNPALAATRFAPVTRARPWPDGPVRRAAVSAFGFGGINAHVILESDESPSGKRGSAKRPTDKRGAAPSTGTAGSSPSFSSSPSFAGRADSSAAGAGSPVGQASSSAGRAGFPADFAAPGEPVLRLTAGSAAEMAALLETPDSELLARAGERAASDGPADSGRDANGPGGEPCRLAIVAPDARRLALARKVARRGTPWRGRGDLWFTPSPLLRGPEQVAFLFPGFEPEFTPRIDGVAEALGLPAPALHAVAAAGSGDGVIEQALDVIAVSRLYAAALAGLGIAPGALAGHSLGEWTAMVVAGIYPEIDEFTASLRPGMVEVPDVVYLALGASATRALELTADLDGVALTHDNCPRQSVVCGPAARIAQAGERAREAGILAQALPFRTGFHSPAFAPYTEPLRRTLGAVEVRPPSVPLWSATTVSPFPRDPGAIRDLVLRHLVEPVRFRQLTELLHEEGIRAFVQVGPGSLTGFADDTLDGREFLTVATATPKRDGLGQLRRAAAALWAEGLSPDFGHLANSDPGRPAAPDRERLAASGGSRPDSNDRDSTGRDSADRNRAGRNRGGKPVRLRLGDPFVRLDGVMPPLVPGGAGVPATAVPPFGPAGAFDPARASDPAGRFDPVGASDPARAFGPVGAELNALLAETAAAAESVVAALSAPVPAPPPVTAPPSVPAPRPISAPPAPAPSAGPTEIAVEREFSLRTMPDMADHCILPQPPGWHDDTDRFPVVPATTLLEIMADAALEAAPGQVVIGFEQVKAMRWLAVAPATFATVRATVPDTGRVRVSIEGYASGDVLLADRYPAAPDPDTTPLRGRRPAPVSARELYRDGWMFHGPRFAGVDGIATLADDGIAGTVLALAARGALLDSAGQLIGHWMQVSRDRDQVVLPTGVRAVRVYGPTPTDGQPLAAVAWIREVTATEMRADAELSDADGRVWCRIEGWSTRRFATDDASWKVKNHPGTAMLSAPGPGGWCVVREGWPDTASRELTMRRYLNAAERADYDRRNPLAQRRWLLGRIAAKDAVRQFLWDRGAGPLYPCELIVTEADGDFRVRGPLRAPPVTVILSPDGQRGRPWAAAAAGDDVDALKLEGLT